MAEHTNLPDADVIIGNMFYALSRESRNSPEPCRQPKEQKKDKTFVQVSFDEEYGTIYYKGYLDKWAPSRNPEDEKNINLLKSLGSTKQGYSPPRDEVLFTASEINNPYFYFRDISDTETNVLEKGILTGKDENMKNIVDGDKFTLLTYDRNGKSFTIKTHRIYELKKTVKGGGDRQRRSKKKRSKKVYK